MKLQLLQEMNNRGTPLPISFNPGAMSSKKPDIKQGSLKV